MSLNAHVTCTLHAGKRFWTKHINFCQDSCESGCQVGTLTTFKRAIFTLSCMLYYTGFNELPSSLVVSPGTKATFRCRHQTADIIGWLVNGTSVGQIITQDILPGTINYEGGILVHTLTIVAYPEYNESEVECVASFIRQGLSPELSPAVTLTILEGLYKQLLQYTSTVNTMVHVHTLLQYRVSLWGAGGGEKSLDIPPPPKC